MPTPRMRLDRERFAKPWVFLEFRVFVMRGCHAFSFITCVAFGGCSASYGLAFIQPPACNARAEQEGSWAEAPKAPNHGIVVPPLSLGSTPKLMGLRVWAS